MSKAMKRAFAVLLVFVIVLAGCNRNKEEKRSAQVFFQTGATASLTEARRGFKTKLVRQEADHEPVASPPAELFRRVRYDSPAGKLAAYISQPVKDGKKHPAILWIFGGFGNDIGDIAWQEAPPEND